ncbi:MAG: hypothetical protein NT065_03415 [Chlamydiae bacterium]|nr:hypothetical protein [Chlamydiota bacterium]
MFLEKLRYHLLRLITWPIGFLPYKIIHHLGNFLGLISYYMLGTFRKKALSNIAMAKALNLDNASIIQVGKDSFKNLMITCLEYPKFAREKHIQNIAHCKNPEEALSILEENKGVIFFCGHQANWEILFLEGTSRMPGVAIGKPVKNQYLYKWVLSIREKFGGRIITPKNAIKEGLRTLKKGGFLGIVGDQGMPDSGFSSDFLGRKAWTSPISAILSYRSGRPIIVATTQRQNHKYIIQYEKAIWPDLTKPMEEEIPRLMGHCLSVLEKSIQSTPYQWLWQHNRWKQQLPGSVKKKYRLDSLCVVIPEKTEGFKGVIQDFRRIYPTELIVFILPESLRDHIKNDVEEIHFYKEADQCFLDDYRIKLLFNFTGNKAIDRHFKKRATIQTLNTESLAEAAGLRAEAPLPDLLARALLHAR